MILNHLLRRLLKPLSRAVAARAHQSILRELPIIHFLRDAIDSLQRDNFLLKVCRVCMHIPAGRVGGLRLAIDV